MGVKGSEGRVKLIKDVWQKIIDYKNWLLYRKKNSNNLANPTGVQRRITDVVKIVAIFCVIF